MSQWGREERENALGWGVGQTRSQPVVPSSLLPDSEPDGAGSCSTSGNRVACSRRLGQGGSQWSTGKTFRTIKSQKEKCFPFAVLSVKESLGCVLSENRPRQVALSSYDRVASLVFFCCSYFCAVDFWQMLLVFHSENTIKIF